eukprot:544996-Rhodomonas_salina.1
MACGTEIAYALRCARYWESECPTLCMVLRERMPYAVLRLRARRLYALRGRRPYAARGTDIAYAIRQAYEARATAGYRDVNLNLVSPYTPKSNTRNRILSTRCASNAVSCI